MTPSDASPGTQPTKIGWGWLSVPCPRCGHRFDIEQRNRVGPCVCGLMFETAGEWEEHRLVCAAFLATTQQGTHLKLEGNSDV